eukprot:TRINITY_DN1911_c0_g2_i1.p1 TRINITY_DN1911_c0_g2~~TRINITY_DN1911_c0_g2_i1.p1  ORF type:complete len:757 (-),score=181.49 TRINITY_DN1911_c0_g2_i1:1397-3457(-)
MAIYSLNFTFGEKVENCETKVVMHDLPPLNKKGIFIISKINSDFLNETIFVNEKLRKLSDLIVPNILLFDGNHLEIRFDGNKFSSLKWFEIHFSSCIMTPEDQSTNIIGSCSLIPENLKARIISGTITTVKEQYQSVSILLKPLRVNISSINFQAVLLNSNDKTDYSVDLLQKYRSNNNLDDVYSSFRIIVPPKSRLSLVIVNPKQEFFLFALSFLESSTNVELHNKTTEIVSKNKNIFFPNNLKIDTAHCIQSNFSISFNGSNHLIRTLNIVIMNSYPQNVIATSIFFQKRNVEILYNPVFTAYGSKPRILIAHPANFNYFVSCISSQHRYVKPQYYDGKNIQITYSDDLSTVDGWTVFINNSAVVNFANICQSNDDFVFVQAITDDLSEIYVFVIETQLVFPFDNNIIILSCEHPMVKVFFFKFETPISLLVKNLTKNSLVSYKNFNCFAGVLQNNVCFRLGLVLPNSLKNGSVVQYSRHVIFESVYDQFLFDGDIYIEFPTAGTYYFSLKGNDQGVIEVFDGMTTVVHDCQNNNEIKDFYFELTEIREIKPYLFINQFKKIEILVQNITKLAKNKNAQIFAQKQENTLKLSMFNNKTEQQVNLILYNAVISDLICVSLSNWTNNLFLRIIIVIIILAGLLIAFFCVQKKSEEKTPQEYTLLKIYTDSDDDCIHINDSTNGWFK